MSPQQSIAHYRVTSKLGEGGMGAVYRATDTKLNREVAIKALPEEFAADPARLARFTREAHVLASLNHPNIAAIYGVEDRALVMELVEGKEARGPLPDDEAMQAASQLIDALDYAHERGVVHRDLKPSNLKITPEGKLKILDFGLAKAAAGEAAAGVEGNPMSSPTLTIGASVTGCILGTAAYMAPEQARGQNVDQRADIWAFGVVLYELVTGKRLFQGATVSDTLASVLRQEIDLTPVPKAFRPLLRACLERDPRRRLRDIGDARLFLERGGEEPQAPAPRWAWLALAMAGALLLASAFLMVRGWRSADSTGPRATVSAALDLAPAAQLETSHFGRPNQTAMAFSPDGRMLVFSGAGGHGGAAQLYKRMLDEPQAAPIPATEGASGPFFSPDGRWIGFWADGQLKKVSLYGGPAISICKTGEPWGAAWGRTGAIVFARPDLMQVSSDGGEPSVLLKSSQAGEHFASPEFLPDGETLLVTRRFPSTAGADDEVLIRPPQGGEPRVILKGGAGARYLPAGYLLYLRNGALMAAAFDAGRLTLTGPSIPMLDGVMQSTNAPNTSVDSGIGQFAVSRSGDLVYAEGGVYPDRSGTLVRVDSHGAVSDLNLPKAYAMGMRLSPDAQRLAILPSPNLSRDVWTYDLARGTAMRLTSAGDGGWLAWPPDGRTIAFEVRQTGQIDTVAVDGQRARETLATGQERIAPASFSPDGKWLAYLEYHNGRWSRIWVRPMSGNGDRRLFVDSQFTLGSAEFSADGKWIAYDSTETGNSEIYIQSFPGGGERHRISVDGGTNPAWARNSRELFYIKNVSSSPGAASTSTLCAVDIGAGPFRAGAPRSLFNLGFRFSSEPVRSYDVYPDGQHFILVRPNAQPEAAVTKLRLALNWLAELKRRSGAN